MSRGVVFFSIFFVFGGNNSIAARRRGKLDKLFVSKYSDSREEEGTMEYAIALAGCYILFAVVVIIHDELVERHNKKR